MSGFNVAELMPFYLDETDEHIAALNDALLRLEQDPADAKALQEAFRFFHSIKGSSVIMGFVPVNKLTHHLESLYDQLRSAKRILDRATLDLTFRCLDELRDYHRDLRAHGQSEVELAGSIARVVEHLAQTQAPSAAPVGAVSQAPKSNLAEPVPQLEHGADGTRRVPATAEPVPQLEHGADGTRRVPATAEPVTPVEHGAGGTRGVAATTEPVPTAEHGADGTRRVPATAEPVTTGEHGADGTRRVPATAEPVRPAVQSWPDLGAAFAVVVIFQSGLPLADMKARLVLNRLSAKARIHSTSPPVEQLDEIETLRSFTVFLTTEAEAAELRSLADVEGVEEIRLEPMAGTDSRGAAGQASKEARAGARALPEPESRSDDHSKLAKTGKATDLAAAAGPQKGDRGAAAPCRGSLTVENRRSPKRSGSTATGSTT